MSTVLERWQTDIPAQFQEANNILAIITALSHQLDEVEQVNADLIEKTDIDTAEGAQLDRLGEIVNISRQEAYKLVELTNAETLDDTTYRNVLRFKALKNNSPGTYADIMKGLYLLWGDLGADISYKENDREPAQISIDISDIPSDAMDPTMIQPMVIKPGGVRIYFTASFLDKIATEVWEHFTNLQVTWGDNHKYNAAYNYNAAIRYRLEDGKIFNEYDGAYRYNAEIMYGGYEQEDIDTVDAIILNQAKKKMLRFRATGSDGWQITHIAFGTGTVNGKKYTPSADATSLLNQVAVNAITHADFISDTKYQYTGELASDQCNGQYITEMGLVDSDGDLVCIKTFDKKFKPAGVAMTFRIDDLIE